MPFTYVEGLQDIPQVIDLVTSIVDMLNKEAAATTFAEKQKLSEPVQEKLAALVDVVKAQVAS
jgi:hypothetical protein